MFFFTKNNSLFLCTPSTCRASPTYCCRASWQRLPSSWSYIFSAILVIWWRRIVLMWPISFTMLHGIAIRFSSNDRFYSLSAVRIYRSISLHTKCINAHCKVLLGFVSRHFISHFNPLLIVYLRRQLLVGKCVFLSQIWLARFILMRFSPFCVFWGCRFCSTNFSLFFFVDPFSIFSELFFTSSIFFSLILHYFPLKKLCFIRSSDWKQNL